ncbi:F-box domain-containing protein [Mycena venus]|uniref:F-box domain-containing protein n=1 Tax=Mycena venus TaxID=2733690 RepID=A0A8H6Y609_9AGAR|nr:F-box domain-containing protein [Mycena venus]
MPFSMFPLDVVLEVMGWCSPIDILNVRATSRLFWNLIAHNPSLWRLARANVLLDFNLPGAAVSEAWLATYVFAPGPCAVCRRRTTELPLSFSLEIRLCSDSCGFHLLKSDPEHFHRSLPRVLVSRPDPGNILHIRHFLAFFALPYLEGTRGAEHLSIDDFTRLYRPSLVRAVVARPRVELPTQTQAAVLPPRSLRILQTTSLGDFMEMTETLVATMTQYRARRRVVQEKNRAFLAVLAHREGLTFDQLAASPTLGYHFNVFARDLTLFSGHAWSVIREVCLAEATQRMPANGRCPFCPRRRLIPTDRQLRQHIEAQHQEEHVYMLLKHHLCTLCPPGSSVYTWKNLKRHIEQKHPERPSI